jgi:hypothetical protein
MDDLANDHIKALTHNYSQPQGFLTSLEALKI